MAGDRLTGWVAIAMAWCAGFVDAAAYLRVSRTYTSHITGNTSTVARRMIEGQWQTAGRAGWAILCFCVGLLISATLQHIERGKSMRPAFPVVLGLEIILLGVFIPLAGLPSAPLWLLIFLPAAAMGMQTVTVRRVGTLRLYTTFMTGNLSEFSETLTGYLFWARDRMRGRFRSRCLLVLRLTPRQETAQRAAVSLGLWLAFLTGTVCGIAGDLAWGAIVMLLPMAVLAAIIPLDLRRPRAIESK